MLFPYLQSVAEHLVGRMAAAIPQILLGVHMLNIGLNYLGKILTLLGNRTSAALKPPYLDFDPFSAAACNLVILLVCYYNSHARIEISHESQ
jgi:hypothetical protein